MYIKRGEEDGWKKAREREKGRERRGEKERK